ncbi:MAG: mechanosensitive ion channel family protein [Candidatus Pacebacteria bacterium]|nr:mechanosensitive ion channel family protein [Candidatus Paceibacterota bacterium]
MIDYFEQLNQALGMYTGITIASYIVAILILVVFFILAQITNFLFNKVFKVLTAKTKNSTDDKIMKILNMPIFYSVVLFGVYQSFSYIGILSNFSDDFSRIIKSFAIIIWIYAISKLVNVIISEIGFKFAEKTKSTLDDELMPLFQKLSNIVIIFAGVMFLLKMWNIDITPLLASAGIMGFVIAFAAQDTLAHLFGGISIYFDKPFRVGDRIQLDSAEYGDVLEIGIRSTRIKTVDETVIVIPNSIIAGSKIINYNQPAAKIKEKIIIKVAYGSDVDKVKKILFDIMREIDEIEKDPAPDVSLTELGDFSLNFLIVAWVDSPKKKFTVKTKINEEVYNRFNKEGIIIPYPTQDIYLKNNKK